MDATVVAVTGAVVGVVVGKAIYGSYKRNKHRKQIFKDYPPISEETTKVLESIFREAGFIVDTKTPYTAIYSVGYQTEYFIAKQKFGDDHFYFVATTPSLHGKLEDIVPCGYFRADHDLAIKFEGVVATYHKMCSVMTNMVPDYVRNLWVSHSVGSELNQILKLRDMSEVVALRDISRGAGYYEGDVYKTPVKVSLYK